MGHYGACGWVFHNLCSKQDHGGCGFQLAQLIKSLMVIQEIWGSIPTYIKNWLVSWSDDKELSSRADTIGWNSLKKKNNISILAYFILPNMVLIDRYTPTCELNKETK